MPVPNNNNFSHISGAEHLANTLKSHMANQAQVFHQSTYKRPGLFGTFYRWFVKTLSSKSDAVDFEVIYSNNSACTHLQLLWDIWSICGLLIFPKIGSKLRKWGIVSTENKPIDYDQQNEANFKESLIKLKLRPRIHLESITEEDPSENVIFSNDNLDLPFPESNPSMVDLCTYYNQPISDKADSDISNSNKNFRSSTDCLLDWSDDETDMNNPNYHQNMNSPNSHQTENGIQCKENQNKETDNHQSEIRCKAYESFKADKEIEIRIKRSVVKIDEKISAQNEFVITNKALPNGRFKSDVKPGINVQKENNCVQTQSDSTNLYFLIDSKKSLSEAEKETQRVFDYKEQSSCEESSQIISSGNVPLFHDEVKNLPSVSINGKDGMLEKPTTEFLKFAIPVISEHEVSKTEQLLTNEPSLIELSINHNCHPIVTDDFSDQHSSDGTKLSPSDEIAKLTSTLCTTDNVSKDNDIFEATVKFNFSVQQSDQESEISSDSDYSVSQIDQILQANPFDFETIPDYKIVCQTKRIWQKPTDNEDNTNVTLHKVNSIESFPATEILPISNDFDLGNNEHSQTHNANDQITSDTNHLMHPQEIEQDSKSLLIDPMIINEYENSSNISKTSKKAVRESYSYLHLSNKNRAYTLSKPMKADRLVFDESNQNEMDSGMFEIASATISPIFDEKEDQSNNTNEDVEEDPFEIQAISESNYLQIQIRNEILLDSGELTESVENYISESNSIPLKIENKTLLVSDDLPKKVDDYISETNGIQSKFETETLLNPEDLTKSFDDYISETNGVQSKMESETLLDSEDIEKTADDYISQTNGIQSKIQNETLLISEDLTKIVVDQSTILQQSFTAAIDFGSSDEYQSNSGNDESVCDDDIDAFLSEGIALVENELDQNPNDFDDTDQNKEQLESLIETPTSEVETETKELKHTFEVKRSLKSDESFSISDLLSNQKENLQELPSKEHLENSETIESDSFNKQSESNFDDLMDNGTEIIDSPKDTELNKAENVEDMTKAEQQTPIINNNIIANNVFDVILPKQSEEITILSIKEDLSDLTPADEIYPNKISNSIPTIKFEYFDCAETSILDVIQSMAIEKLDILSMETPVVKVDEHNLITIQFNCDQGIEQSNCSTKTELEETIPSMESLEEDFFTKGNDDVFNQSSSDIVDAGAKNEATILDENINIENDQQFITTLSTDPQPNFQDREMSRSIAHDMFTCELETLFEEDDPHLNAQNFEIHHEFTDEVQITDDQVWQKTVHIPIPDMSPPQSPIQREECFCTESTDYCHSYQCKNFHEEIYSDPDTEDQSHAEDSRSDALNSTDFSYQSSGTKRHSFKGYLQRKWSKIRKSKSKLDLSQEPSQDLTPKSKWKRSAPNLSFSASLTHTSPGSSLNGSLSQTGNRSWAGSTRSIFGKKKRGKLVIEHDAPPEEVEPTKVLLSRWQHSRSIPNILESLNSEPISRKPVPSLSAVSMGNLFDSADESNQE